MSEFGIDQTEKWLENTASRYGLEVEVDYTRGDDDNHTSFFTIRADEDTYGEYSFPLSVHVFPSRGGVGVEFSNNFDRFLEEDIEVLFNDISKEKKFTPEFPEEVIDVAKDLFKVLRRVGNGHFMEDFESFIGMDSQRFFKGLRAMANEKPEFDGWIYEFWA